MNKEYSELVSKMSEEYIEKNKFKIFANKINPFLPFFSFIISIIALMISIIALFK